MRAFYILLRLRLLDVTRKPLTGFFILIMPVVLLVTLSGIFAGGHPFERRRVSVVEGAPVPAALASLPGLHVLHAGSERAALGGLSSRMTDAVIAPGPEGARLLVRDKDEIFGRGLAGALGALGERVTLTVVLAPRWGYMHYLFPGLLALAVVLTGLYGMGYTMVRYRATQFLKKLSTTPLPRSTFVAAQLVARTVLVLAQTVLMALAAWLLFGLPLTLAGFAWLMALTALGLLTFMGAGFALACVIRVESNMQDVINSITGPLILLSEIFFSADELPGPLPVVAAALPSTQLVRALRAVLLEGEAGAALLAPGMVMVGWMAATFVVSVAVFRWND